ncbi:MAG: 4'-phosphopantetheinyl transferase superfamily protein [Clostridium sp.]|nr:4'-phosphopantetheinyl transferase superfamily protein [Clostridium sp.]
MITVYYRKVFPLQKESAFLRAGSRPDGDIGGKPTENADAGIWLPPMNEMEKNQLNKIEEKRREKISRIKSPKQKRLSLAAGVLLHDALCGRLGADPEKTPPFNLQYGENGKPYLSEYPNIHFNLSHSGDYVCCALSGEPVGVDIQEKLEEKEKVAERFFTSADRVRLSAWEGEQRRDLFFRMWSIKESYIKLTGEGMARGLSGFEIDWERSCIIENKEGRLDTCFAESEAEKPDVCFAKSEMRKWDACFAEIEVGKPIAYFAETEISENYCLCVCSYTPQKVMWKGLEEQIR